MKPRDPSTVQMKHPRTGRWMLVNMSTGRVIRSAVARWVDVPVKVFEAGKHYREKVEGDVQSPG